jgi:hypothetical protein
VVLAFCFVVGVTHATTTGNIAKTWVFLLLVLNVFVFFVHAGLYNYLLELEQFRNIKGAQGRIERINNVATK